MEKLCLEQGMMPEYADIVFLLYRGKKDAIPDEVVRFFADHDVSGKRFLLISIGEGKEPDDKEELFQFITGEHGI